MTIPNKFGHPDLGVGVGLRPEYYAHLTEHWPNDVDFFEVISENFIDTEGRPLYYLDMFAERYPIVLHGVSLSIGTTDPINFEYLAKLKALADRVNAPWMGDHVCWTGVGGKNGHDLYPVPYNEVTLKHLVDRIRTVQDFLERPLVMENPSTYASFTVSTMTEQEFIRRMADEADCALLLDVNNIYVQARNHDLDMWDYLKQVPFDRVTQIHVAGHTDKGDHCVDTHDNYVVDPVWELYAEVHNRTGGRGTILEWDDNWPEGGYPAVWEEALKAVAVRQRVDAARTEPAHAG